jgi:hypothetical protein
MYYVVPRGTSLNLDMDPSFHTFSEAKEYAEDRRNSYGAHSHVVKIETVWVTTTMADLMAEGAKLRGEMYIA